MSSRLVAKADTFVIITKELVITLKHDTLPRKIRGDDAAKVERDWM